MVGIFLIPKKDSVSRESLLAEGRIGLAMAAVAVVLVESAIAGKRLTLIEQAKGCHESMAPFFVCFANTKKRYTDDLMNTVVIAECERH